MFGFAAVVMPWSPVCSLRRLSSLRSQVLELAGNSCRVGQIPGTSQSTKTSQQARVFINGDSMPEKGTIEWLAALRTRHPDILVWKAVGSSANVGRSVKKFENVPGMLADHVNVVQARTLVSNAADALLTALYGRYADKASMNYVVSSDKKWFSELPYVFPDTPTTWLTFGDLGKECETLRSTSSHREWKPGHYMIVHTAAVTGGFRRRSTDVGELKPGVQVEVLEIKDVKKDFRIRGRIEEPAGWISLFDQRDRHAWALPAFD